MVLRKLITLIAGILAGLWCLNAQVDLPYNSTFKILKGSQASDLSSGWSSLEFNDNQWLERNAPFWYGDGSGGTELSDMRYNYSTLFLRKSFTATNVERISTLTLNVDYDDGFIVWINGKSILRRNAPVVESYNAFAPANHESGSPETFIFDSTEVDLREGENILAIQGFNVSLESSDFYLNLSLSAEPALPEYPVFPDSLGVSFSHESGYYTNPFSLEITSPSDTVDLFYTLDGSHPGLSSTAKRITDTETVTISPYNNTGGGITPAVVVRTSFRGEGFKPSPPLSRTYIFPSAVNQQNYPGGIWPQGNVNGQILDYAVDTEISLGETYGRYMESSLKDIPAISIITDIKNLFGETEGIYVNAYGHGHEWERECSIEMIYPDSVAFQTNAGLRIRGGWSRHPDFPKHSFRLFFRSEYGDAKLNYPLFGDEGVDKFDKIDLRTSQNYAWAQGDSRNTMLREVFSRDLQGDMGQPYTRSRYYHLYLNGMYWGVYQSQERSEARFASSYFGDSPDDYDVVKVNTEDWVYRIEATDGNLDLWREIYDLTNQGFSSLENYYKLEGKDKYGKTSKNTYKLVDIDNLIDYMISIFYTGNFDAPTSSFGQNNGCNNFYALNERDNPITGFIFFNHDAEHSLFYQPASPGIGIYEDRVNLATRTDNLRMTVDGFDRFHPQWLHYKLTSNEEYIIRFNDRAWKYLREGGLLTNSKCQERMRVRAEELYDAIIAESARWGDAKTSSSYTRDDHWLPEVEQIRTLFFKFRPDIFRDQLMEGGLYTTVRAPVFEIDDNFVTEDYVSINSAVNLKIKNTSTSGDIYYTIDGRDPRLTGGEVSRDSENAGSEISIDVSGTTVVRARVLSNEGWSALSELVFLAEVEDYSGLKVTEIHYYPLDSIAGSDTLSGKDFEFIEFKNTGSTSINLSGLRIDSAISYTFPEKKVLLPREFFVIASKPVKFYQRYGLIPSGNYEGNLANEGEVILVEDAKRNKVMHFGYSNGYSWPIEAGGSGYSLVPAKSDPDIFPGLPEYWKRSAKMGGSPFANDGNSEINKIREEFVESINVYPNPASEYVTIDIAETYKGAEITIDFYDFTAKKVLSARIYNGESINLSGRGLSPGIYILDISSQGYKYRKKLMFTGRN
jgi:hypothetical protein